VRSFELERAPERWYQHWWVWAITGTVVAAATTTVILLESRDTTGSVKVTLPEGNVGSTRASWVF